MAPIIMSLLPMLGNVLDKILPDPKAASDAKIKIMEMAQTGELAQLASDTELAKAQIGVNLEEAKSESLFKSGWRPATGWACVGGLVYQVLARPILGWGALNLWNWTEPPPLDMDTLMTLLFGLLGLGAYRTVERIKRKV